MLPISTKMNQIKEIFIPPSPGIYKFINKCNIQVNGEVAEWSKAPVLKTGERASVPWVRIPPSPPFFKAK